MDTDKNRKDHAPARFEKGSPFGNWCLLIGKSTSPAKSVFICVHLWFSHCLVAVGSLAVTSGLADQPYLHAPSVETYAKHDPTGLTILANGRYIKPVGRHLPVGHSSYGLAMSRDGKFLFVASDGVGQLITDWQQAKPTVAVINPPAHQSRPGKKAKPTNAGGADFLPDGRTLYWSSGETGGIYFFDTDSGKKLAEVSLNGAGFVDSFAMDV